MALHASASALASVPAWTQTESSKLKNQSLRIVNLVCTCLNLPEPVRSNLNRIDTSLLMIACISSIYIVLLRARRNLCHSILKHTIRKIREALRLIQNFTNSVILSVAFIICNATIRIDISLYLNTRHQDALAGIHRCSSFHLCLLHGPQIS